MGWRPPDGLDRMTLAAALEKLTDGYDDQAARQVIVGFYSLPATKEKDYVADTVCRERSEVTDGDDVAIDVSEDTYRSFGKANEEESARVGRFTVYKSDNTFPDCLGIIFGDSRSNTWEGMNADPLPKWGLAFDQPTLQPLALVRIDYVPAKPRLWPRLLRLWLCLKEGMLYSKCKYWEQSVSLIWVVKAS